GSFEFSDTENKVGFNNAYDRYRDYKLLNIDQDVTFDTKANSTVTFNLKPYLGNGHGYVNTPRALNVSANITAKGTGRVTFDANANGYAVAGMYFGKRSDDQQTTIKTENTTTLEFKGLSASREGLAIKNPLVLDAQEGSRIIALATSLEPCANAIAQAVNNIKILKTFSTAPKVPLFAD
ncbi:hypothetical protein HAINFHK1212_0583, partial [Haemophilus influenzae HK1212]